MKNLFTTTILVLLFAVSFAQIPAGYYDGTDGLTGDNLRMELRTIVDDHTALSYSGLWSAYYTTDVYPAPNDDIVWDMYSSYGDGTWAYSYTIGDGQCGNVGTEGTCYNREHSVPQSWFNEQSPMVTDLFIVVPTDGSVNGMRSSFPYGEVASPTNTSQNGSKKGSCTYPGYTGTVFEPIDAYKGDFARTYFYVVTRYDVSGWGGASWNGDGFSDWTQEMLLEWNALDPVSQKEIDRNNAVYAKQGNRNPYIDHEEWAECVFNNNCGSSVVAPQNFVANGISVSQIELNWDLNNAGNDVVLAYNTTNTFGSPAGTYSAGNTISGGGTVLYTGTNTQFTHDATQTYYYKIWSYDGTDYSIGVTDMASPFMAAPSNHATNFTTLNPTASSIEVSWTDAVGDIIPLGYLVKANYAGSDILNPISGQVENEGLFTKNVAYGEQIVTFDGLTQNTEYDFEIFPYSNSGVNIDYKTDGVIPQTSGSTTDMPAYCGNETFEGIGTAMYETTTWTGQDGTLWTATDARTDQNIGNGKAICIRNGYVESGTQINGISSITISTFLPFADDAGDITVKINGDIVGTVPYSTTETQTTTIENINITDDIIIKLESPDANRVIIDDVIWTCYAGSAGNDNDSDIEEPTTQIAATTILDYETNFVNVFSFNIKDKGTADGQPTLINSIKIYPKSPENTADWTSSINSIKINDGTTDLDLASVTITDTYMNIPFTNAYEIADNSTTEFTLSFKISDQFTDDSNLAFMIDADNHGFVADIAGSGLLSVANLGNDIISNIFTLFYFVNISEINENNIIIYPNPSSTGIFYIKINRAEKTQISIFDINGRNIISKNIDNNNNKIDISKEGKGLFLMKIQTDNSIIWKKIITN